MLKKTLFLITILTATISYGQVRLETITTGWSYVAITIKNHGSSTVNINDYWLSISNNNFKISDLVTQGYTNQTTTIPPNGQISLNGSFGGINGNSNTDFSLYQNNNFNSTTAMLDFIQVGSTGNGREAIAISKGIWQSGDYLTREGVLEGWAQGNHYFYSGATQSMAQGKQYWEYVGLLNTPEEKLETTKLLPNPATTHFSIIIKNKNSINSIVVYDMTGKIVLKKKQTENIDVSALPKGIYLVHIDFTDTQITKKLIVK